MKLVRKFKNDEDGAVTVDWVVLTAAVVALGLAVLLAITNASTSLADRISTTIVDVLP
ncbi:MAG: hypothetical protein AAGA87_12905 [Pseudomonadota bacterium]